jgi:repressor LexA
MKALTIRQKLVLDFIKNYVEEHQYAPSFREIQSHFGLASLASVHKHIKSLEAKGVLTTTKGLSRSIELSADLLAEGGKPFVSIPLMGYLTEKEGIETLSQVKTMEFPETLISSSKRTYLLRVRGSFLKSVSIEYGDLLVVESETDPDPDRLVLLQTSENEFLVRYYYPESGGVCLKVSTEDEGEFYSFEELTIYGVIIAVLRTF